MPARALILLGLAFALPTSAQVGPTFPLERPGERISELPLPDRLQSPAPSILPSIPEPSLGEIQGDDPSEGVLIQSVEIRGNRAIESTTLNRSIEAFVGRRLGAEGLEAIRRALTEVYVDAGFVNSGATIPPQTIVDGRLVIEIVEGQLEQILISGLEHYREKILRERVSRGIDAPLNVKDIEREIRLLDQDPRVEKVTARLRPGSRREAAVLELDLVEADPRRLTLGFDNEESPSVGAYAGRLEAAHLNVLGLGDRLRFNLTQTEGLTRVGGRYEVPINAFGTRLSFDARFGYAELVDDLAKELDIVSTDASFAIELGQNLWHTPQDRIDFSVRLERRRSKTELGGRGTSFVDGPQAGRSEITVVRFLAEWSRRNPNSVFALRGMLSWGNDWLNPTTQPNGLPDGEFLSGYLQGRGIYRFPQSGIEVRLRSDLQLSNDPLLSLEQFAVGGPGSVRGYRRNQLVRDQGFTAGLDVRFPLLRAANDRTVVAFSPIIDFGYAWNRERNTPAVRTLSSVGAKLEWSPRPEIELGLEYAYGFRDVDRSNDLQERSVYLFARWRLF